MLRDSTRGTEQSYILSAHQTNKHTHPTSNQQIGLKHGTSAKPQIHRCIAFYAALFLKSANKTWTEVQALALTFEPTIRKNWPAYLEEMDGKFLFLFLF